MLITGIDIIEINRIAKIDRFLKRIYTDDELYYCKGRFPQLASRFAAKEATMKALGTGIRGVGWKDVEVSREKGKAPIINLSGRAILRANKIGLNELTLTLSHSKEYAVASVVGNCDNGNMV
jgi:holo-[acyl-carrier protein] synthase